MRPGLNLRCSSCNGMADIASLFVEIREIISCDQNTRSILDGLDFHVWEDVPTGGLLTYLYLFRYWSNSISGGGFIRRFLTRWGFTLPVYRFAFSDFS